MTTRLKTLSVNSLPLLAGVFAAIYILGWNILDPTNVAWLGQRHTEQIHYYAAWKVFRDAPWTFPLGLNPNIGMEAASSVAYADAIPLLAILFKPFSPLLPPTFHYFGLWIFLGVVMQTWFGWKLVGLYTYSPLTRLCGACLFVFLPAYMWRPTAHYAMGGGHFLILASLYLAIRPSNRLPHSTLKRIAAWAAVLMAATMVHAYLALVCASVWGADILWRRLVLERNLKGFTIEFFCVTTLVLLAAWQAGFFVAGTIAAEGKIGSGCQLPLLSFIDGDGHSVIFTDQPPQNNCPWDPGTYLGAGNLILFGCAIYEFIRQRRFPKEIITARPILLLVIILMFIWALISQTLFIGPYVFDFHLDFFNDIRIFSMFRSNHRLAWLMDYAFVLGSIYCVIKYCNRKSALILLVLTLTVQVVDTKYWRQMNIGIRQVPRHTSMNSSMREPMPLWAETAQQYKKLETLPYSMWSGTNYFMKSTVYGGIVEFAINNGLETSLYLGARGAKSMDKARHRVRVIMESGTYKADTIYIVDPSHIGHVKKTINKEADLLTEANGYVLLLPGWKLKREYKPGLYRDIGIE